MGGLGPMACQANHFRVYASEKIPCAIDGYTNEVNRLFGVMNRRLADREYLAGRYSIADIASVGWTRGGSAMVRRFRTSPISRGGSIPAVQRGLSIDIPGRQQHDLSKDAEARKILFGQRAC
jgi:GSH-dependent disulfide-bond oxidoreductase